MGHGNRSSSQKKNYCDAIIMVIDKEINGTIKLTTTLPFEVYCC